MFLKKKMHEKLMLKKLPLLLRLLAEVNRLFKILNFKIFLKQALLLLPSSCLSDLTLLVSQLDSLSSRDKRNLICDARLSFIRCAALSSCVQF